MGPEVSELEKIITNNLKTVISLNNEVEQKELEKQDLLKEIALSIIDILDSFERIEERILEKGLNAITGVEKTMKRYSSIQKKLLNLLQQHGITKIEFPDNRLIIGLCEVVETEVDENRKNDEIFSIVKNGYIRGKELIRAAQVVVIKN